MDLKKSLEQTIDTTSKDEVLEAGYSQAATEQGKSDRHVLRAVHRENKDEITALQVLYSQPHGRLQFNDIKALAEAIQAPPAVLDARAALARLRDAGQRQGARGWARRAC